MINQVAVIATTTATSAMTGTLAGECETADVMTPVIVPGLGYSCHGNFSRAFQRKFGVSSSEFRRQRTRW